MRNEQRSTAGVLGGLKAKIANMPRDEFGEQYTLAVEAAYRRCEELVDRELADVCGVQPPPA